MVESQVLSLSYGQIVVKPLEKLHGLVPASFETYQIVEPGDIIIRPTDLQNDWTSLRVGLSSHRGIITSAYLCIRATTPFTTEYAYYLLHAYDLMKVFYGMGSGLRQNLDFADFKWLPVLIPPAEEQATIVRFLDHLNGRVRRYIRAKRRHIALLNEQKQAIIDEAVTRGLDADVPTKKSGQDWLGPMPEHWEVTRNGRLFTQRNQTGYSELPILEVSLHTGVRVRNFDNQDRKQVMADRGQYKRAAAGDIAYNMMRMWQGAVGVVPVDGLVSPAYVVAKPNPGTEPRFFGHLFRTATYMRETDKYSRGIVKDRNRLYWVDFKQMPSPCPPYGEQVQIADFVDQVMQSTNTLVERELRQIELVRELRDRLVADVVTGKLDVREAAETLPDELEEVEAMVSIEEVAEGEEAVGDAGEGEVEVG